MASKTTRHFCQAILCYKVYSGVDSRYIYGCKDVLDTDQDGASGPLT